MVATRNQTAPEPLALFHALLNGNASMARRLLAGSGADQLALVAPASNFTVLHAAVLSRCGALLPQLATLCTAAGVPVDAALQLGRGSMNSLRAAAKQLLLGLGMQRPQHLPELRDGVTPLSLAVSFRNPAAIHALLQAGARPAASPMVADAVCNLEKGCEARQLVLPLLQHGLDPLHTVNPNSYGGSLLVNCWSVEAVDVMLAHLEEQRAAGSLQLGSKQRCLVLLLGACRSSDPPPQLARFGVSQLEQLVGTQAASSGDAEHLDSLLLRAATDGNPAVLSALLASQLPVDLTAAESNVIPGDVGRRGYSVLAVAAMSPQPTACVRLLYEAGAPPTTADFYCAIDSLCPGGVAALLACSVPAIDASQPTAVAPLPPGQESQAAWSCPIHRTLHAAYTQSPWEPPKHKAALQLLEALRAAGFRPTTYTNAALPEFTRPSDNRVLPVLDPFDYYDVERCRQQGLPVARRYRTPLVVPAWLLFAAKDGSWSPATHHHWTDAFKTTARTLLLAANRSSRMAEGGSTGEGGSNGGRSANRRPPREAAAAPSSSRQQPGLPLGALPPELLLRIVKAMAEPLSACL